MILKTRIVFSFFWPKKYLFSVQNIKIIDDPWFRYLYIGNKFIQTKLYKAKPYLPQLEYLPYFCKLALTSDGNILILGLGGGAIAHILEKNYLLENTTFVEHSQEIIKAAHDFFGLAHYSQKILIHKACASEWASRYHGESYQHILVDLADSNGFPEVCLNIEFFENLSNILSSSGYMVINLPNPGLFHQIKIFLITIFQDNFISIVVPGSTNILIFITKFDIDELIKNLLINNVISNFERTNNCGLVGRPYMF